MIQITVDPDLTARLSQLHQAAEICDPAGRILGRFLPAVNPSEWEPLSPEPTEQQLDEAERETVSYSSAEVLALLEKLPCSESESCLSRRWQ
jgi:hypothetical protein